ncbi:MAG: winged helix-turn-helix domain-containing protein [Chloroflexia bacterium]
MGNARIITQTSVRRLAITRQRLAGPRPAGDPSGIHGLVCDLGYLQLDPTSIVARSHLLVLWSRLGLYDPASLDTLLWDERRLFEFWMPAAAIVPTDDYQLYQATMRRFATGDGPWERRVRDWMAANSALRESILAALAADGPLPAERLEDTAAVPWESSGWTHGRNVGRMLDFLFVQGLIMVAGRSRGHRLWHLAERCLPADTPREALTDREVSRRRVQKSVRALGVARPSQIRGGSHDLKGVLAELEAEGRILPVAVAELPGSWYMHADDLPLLDSLEASAWEPRTTLLSPFDSLISDRDRTEELFGFRFRLEIYVPKPKREYGYFVLPILHGDRLIGRLDPALDRKSGRLTINAVYAEPDAPQTPETAEAVRAAVSDLAAFIGAREVAYTDRVPEGWGSGLH